MKIKNVLTSIALVFGFISAGTAQISVQNTLTPNQLVQNILLGFGVTASNITINGSPILANNVQNNVSYFNSGTTSFPIQQGVLLTTGAGIGAVGPNNSTSQTNGGIAAEAVILLCGNVAAAMGTCFCRRKGRLNRSCSL